MTAQVLDGKAIAAAYRRDIRQAVQRRVETGLSPPGLAVVLVGDDAASEVYVNAKARDCRQVGFHSVVERIAATVTQAELEARIRALNADPDIHGFLVQLPFAGSYRREPHHRSDRSGQGRGRLPSPQHRPPGAAPPGPALLHPNGRHAAARPHRRGLLRRPKPR